MTTQDSQGVALFADAELTLAFLPLDCIVQAAPQQLGVELTLRQEVLSATANSHLTLALIQPALHDNRNVRHLGVDGLQRFESSTIWQAEIDQQHIEGHVVKQSASLSQRPSSSQRVLPRLRFLKKTAYSDGVGLSVLYEQNL
jgi:hypothetical protein